MTVRSLTRRLVVLTALRWLPVGLTTPVMVLLAQERGLSLADVGLLFTVYGALVVTLELPTGGLADVVGRRVVLVLATGLHVLASVGIVLADGLPGFLAAMALMGVSRALDSGPLEAWYVDAVHDVDPRADVAPGLARHSAADGGGLAVGALAGGLLPALLGGSLAAPFLVSAALDVVFVGALLRLMTEARPPRSGSARAELAAGARAVPRTVGGAVRLSVSDRALRLVLLVTAAGGVAVVSFELLGPGRFAELAGGPAQGAAVLGTVQAVAFGLAAGAALLAPGLRRVLGGSTRAACAATAVLGAVAVAAFAGAGTVLLAAAALSGYYMAHAAQWPLLSAVLHSRVDAAHRSTAVSAMSLAMALGGIAGNLLLPLLVSQTDVRTAYLAVAALLLLSATACLRLPDPVSRAADAAAAAGPRPS